MHNCQRFTRFFLALAAFAMAGISPSAAAQSESAAVDGAIEQLDPGEYLWAPEIAPEGPVTLIVSLSLQRAYVYRNGVPIGVSTVSTGMPGYETPTGIFTILQKDRDHESNLYDDAPMPFMQRLTWDGIALHAGALPGYPASHGCIRLPPDFAKLLYGITSLGLTVVISDKAPIPEIVHTSLEIFPSFMGDYAGSNSFSWQPSTSPSGPVSLVVSGRDRRIVVLRNGIEIGAAAITIDGPVNATEAFTLTAITDDRLHWLRLSLPGQPPGEAAELTTSDRARLHMPQEFRQNLLGILEPGATLLVTRETLRSGGTGQALTVIVADGDPD